MKGIVFTEFFELVERHHGYATVDQLIEQVQPKNKGAYTAVGTYSHQEMVDFLHAYSALSETPMSDLLKLFGRHLFDVFLKNYPEFFEAQTTAFDFLKSIDDYIHQEVRKLYPDAQLPAFETHSVNSRELIMTYRSERSMSQLALGLIEKTFEHYQQAAEIETRSIDNQGKEVEFRITMSV